MRTRKEYEEIIQGLRRMPRSLESVGVASAAAVAIEELLEAVEKQSSVVRVETPLGDLTAKSSGWGPDYPGIHIDLRRSDADQDMMLALVEFTKTEGDLPDGEGHIITRVYGDDGDEYTHRIVHTGIEEYFKMEEADHG